MALLDGEKIQRIVKGKWFLPALGVGGIVIVLILARKGGGEDDEEAFSVDEGAGVGYGSAPAGASEQADLSGIYKELSGFEEDIGTRIGAIEALQGQSAAAQQKFLDQTADDLYSQLDTGLSGLQYSVPYADPYANYADPYAGGFNDTGYYGGVDDTGYYSDDMGADGTSLVTDGTVNYNTPANAMLPSTRTGQAAKPAVTTKTGQTGTKTGQAAPSTASKGFGGQKGSAPVVVSNVKQAQVTKAASSKATSGQVVATGIASGQTGPKSFAGSPASPAKVYPVTQQKPVQQQQKPAQQGAAAPVRQPAPKPKAAAPVRQPAPKPKAAAPVRQPAPKPVQSSGKKKK